MWGVCVMTLTSVGVVVCYNVTVYEAFLLIEWNE